MAEITPEVGVGAVGVLGAIGWVIKKMVSGDSGAERRIEDRREEDRRVEMHDLRKDVQSLIAQMVTYNTFQEERNENIKEAMKDFKTEVREDIKEIKDAIKGK